MALDIRRNGIALVLPDGSTVLVVPGPNGGPGSLTTVDADLAGSARLATGDVVEGEAALLPPPDPVDFARGDADLHTQFDEPDHPRARPQAAGARPVRQRLATITKINGLTCLSFGCLDRPYPQTRRARSERTPPDRLLKMAAGPNDLTGRILDFAAPLGAGNFGIVFGAHGAGLTSSLQAALAGIAVNAPDCVVLVLLLCSRAEEATEWRRRFPQADVVVGASALSDTPAELTLELCDLMMEAARRQTEAGLDVVLLVDSLTALWGAMLEDEQADAQREADHAHARTRMRDWVQKAGCFHGEGPLGGGLGGSLTLLTTVWHQAIDADAEEEQDLHPHLRLLEHVVSDADWLVPLSETLSEQRLYPTVDVRRCRARYEERLLDPQALDSHLMARSSLPERDPVSAYTALLAALEASSDQAGLVRALGFGQRP